MHAQVRVHYELVTATYITQLQGEFVSVVRRVGGVGRVARVARVRRVGRALAALQVLAVRVLVEAALGHEERGDGARREAHGGGARRDAAAPALAARVVQHVERRHRRPNALCHTHNAPRQHTDTRAHRAHSHQHSQRGDRWCDNLQKKYYIINKDTCCP